MCLNGANLGERKKKTNAKNQTKNNLVSKQPHLPLLHKTALCSFSPAQFHSSLGKMLFSFSQCLQWIAHTGAVKLPHWGDRKLQSYMKCTPKFCPFCYSESIFSVCNIQKQHQNAFSISATLLHTSDLRLSPGGGHTAASLKICQNKLPAKV